jgi:effector-binding domain-containing protein
MSTKIEVTNEKSVIAAAIKLPAVSMDKMMEVIGANYEKLMAYVAEQGKKISGDPYCCYTNANEDMTQFDIELGIPVNEPVVGKDDIFMSQSYAGKAISATHKGSYKDNEATYMALVDYAKENSLELAGPCYDYYLNCPDDVPESELLTRIIFAIA